MVSREVVEKAVETLKGFSPEVIKEAVRGISELSGVMADNNNNNYEKREL
ncbi:MAG: hypothetical protein KAW19_10230 [Candidatus Aminicenantes bacterium]|nr:hypothetical protein [Candidatus Aminicenantes bacterium]